MPPPPMRVLGRARNGPTYTSLPEAALLVLLPAPTRARLVAPNLPHLPTKRLDLLRRRRLNINIGLTLLRPHREPQLRGFTKHIMRLRQVPHRLRNISNPGRCKGHDRPQLVALAVAPSRRPPRFARDVRHVALRPVGQALHAQVAEVQVVPVEGGGERLVEPTERLTRVLEVRRLCLGVEHLGEHPHPVLLRRQADRGREVALSVGRWACDAGAAGDADEGGLDLCRGRIQRSALGVDVTWWGGSPKNRQTQLETIVSACLDDPDSFAIDTVDLRHAANPAREDPTESSFDRDATALLGALRDVVARHPAKRVVVALDAPLEAKTRAGQPPRRRAVGKGEKTGSKRRQAEDHLQQHMSGLDQPQRSTWNPGLKIQAGSPVPPRISAIVEALGQEGYRVYRGGEPPERALLDAQVWGDGTDGAIVGPGRLELVASPPTPRPPLPITIRPASALDTDALLELQAEIHALHVQAEPHRYRHAAPQAVRAHFVALLEDPDAQILVAAGEGALLGCLVAKHERSDHPMTTPQSFVLVDALAVSAKARRHGVGRRLMDAAMAHAQALGTEAVELTVRSFNREAIAFYEALGFGAEQLRMRRLNRAPDA